MILVCLAKAKLLMAQDLLNKKTIDQFVLIGEVFNKYRNPVIGSFIVSWLVINWKVVLFILLYSDSYSNQPFETFIEKITGLGNWCSFYLFPFLSIIFYVVILPIIGLGVRKFYSWISVESEKIFFKTISKKPVSGEKYAILYKSLNQEIRRYTDIVESFESKEAQYIHEVSELRRIVSELVDFKTKANQINDVSSLNGYWTIVTTFHHYNAKTKDLNNEGKLDHLKLNVEILNGVIYEVENNFENKSVYNISGFTKITFDGKNSIQFVRHGIGILNKILVFTDLIIQPNGDLLGKENLKYQVQYKRVITKN